MRVFLIGGTGYIGRAVATALADRGHSPVVLSRSAESRAKVTDDRVSFVEGSVSDLEVLMNEAHGADAVVYLAIAGMRGASPDDLAAIPAILKGYEGTNKAFVLTSGFSAFLGVDGPFISSDTPASASEDQAWRVALERSVITAASNGVRTAVIRPSIVYGNGTASALLLGLMRYVAAGNHAFYIGNGANSIPTVHVTDLAAVYVGAIERGPAGANYNIASGSILGFDLAHAVASAVHSSAEPIDLDFPAAIGALGPAAGALAMDLKVSQWTPTRDLDWSGHENSLALELMRGSITVP